MVTIALRRIRLFTIQAITAAALTACCLCAPSTAANDTSQSYQQINLTSQIAPGDLAHVKVLFELDGTLLLKSETKDPVRLPVQAKARLIYHEKTLQGPTASTPWSSLTVRQYETAKATIRFQEKAVTPQLSGDRQLVASSATSADDVVLFSPLGPLSRDELDLIDMPANSAVIDALLPGRTVKVGASWDLDSDVLPEILGVDALARQDIQCTLHRLDKESALIHAKGSVSGASGGVSTEMTVAAKYTFDLTRKRLSWFAMSLKENRSIGHAQPGIEATIRVQMAVSGSANAPALHDDVLADLNLKADENVRLLEFVSETGGFELLMNRDWHEMLDEQDACVLRLVTRGDLVAQCNLTVLPPLEDGIPFTLSDFQKDIQTVLADEFGEFVAATEQMEDSGLHVMRVAATGIVSEIPINWVYYHIANDQGRRASCVFTFESELADQFGASDQALISSFRFREQIQK